MFLVSAERLFFDLPRARGLTLGAHLSALRALARPHAHTAPPPQLPQSAWVFMFV